MTYVEGFVAAVPRSNREAYLAHASEAAPLIKESGARRLVECWGDDVPPGKRTDFRRAVQARDDEEVVFSWFEYADKATRDRAHAQLSSDPRLKALTGRMPFDGRRLVFGGFASFVDERGARPGGYTDGFVLPVPVDRRDAYCEMATKAAAVFIEYGAGRVVEAWGDDVPEGSVTDFRRAVGAGPPETVVFSWIEWASRRVRDEAWAQVMKDPRMQPGSDTPFDGQRMIWGGFETLIDR